MSRRWSILGVLVLLVVFGLLISPDLLDSKNLRLLLLGLLLAGCMGWELRFAYRTGSVHRAKGGLIHRATEPRSYWLNVYLGWFLLFALLGAALLGAVLYAAEGP